MLTQGCAVSKIIWSPDREGFDCEIWGAQHESLFCRLRRKVSHLCYSSTEPLNCFLLPW